MLENLTPFAAEILPGHGADGGMCRTVVVKATLDFAGRPVAQGRAVPVFRGDEFFREEGLSGTVRHEADLAPAKPKVDVIFNGYAYAPGGRPAARFDAGLAIGRESRTLRVFGKRVWRRRLGLFPVAEEQEPALRVPVIYGLAFGGQDADDPVVFHPANPSGAGFSAGLPPDGAPLHQFEWPDDPVRMASDDVSPAGFGCVGRTWLPRRALWGSYAARELQDAPGIVTRMPATFDPAAWNCAHPRMQFLPAQLAAGTRLRWMHLSADGEGAFTVPDLRPAVSWVARGERATVRPGFDTLVIEPEQEHIVLIWRYTLTQEPARYLESVQVHL
ncbi:DUF2169 domain-containing protein [Paracidovorax anthurii]|uniref:DUF2169 domain-containing protein n=1 Tax=Paracidovorax anthurii TaxID=78229 RepID=A0A328YNF1_9BURK|nr:DUF2169 domain-containing protein [Paracidovorax anthurii]RAR71616.1 hypothetical protein AX018_10903 [Paracidovorax anthurii]WCM94298.1 DUF2169 domain-containing protein [Acidovorax sp. NCPPB 2350]